MKFISQSAEETSELGEKIGSLLGGGEVLILVGDLGGGKTQFTKGLAKGLGVEDTVTSPTFTIERIYPANKFTLRHFDFYRLVGEDKEIVEELEEIQKDPSNVLAVEWPKNLKNFTPKQYMKLVFKYKDEETREISITAKGEKYEQILERVR